MGFSNDKGNHPCSCIAYYLHEGKCKQHTGKENHCPDNVIIQSKLGEYGIPILDNTYIENNQPVLSYHSFTKIDFCLWCNTKL